MGVELNEDNEPVYRSSGLPLASDVTFRPDQDPAMVHDVFLVRPREVWLERGNATNEAGSNYIL